MAHFKRAGDRREDCLDTTLTIIQFWRGRTVTSRLYLLSKLVNVYTTVWNFSDECTASLCRTQNLSISPSLARKQGMDRQIDSLSSTLQNLYPTPSDNDHLNSADLRKSQKRTPSSKSAGWTYPSQYTPLRRPRRRLQNPTALELRATLRNKAWLSGENHNVKRP